MRAARLSSLLFLGFDISNVHRIAVIAELALLSFFFFLFFSFFFFFARLFPIIALLFYIVILFRDASIAGTECSVLTDLTDVDYCAACVCVWDFYIRVY